METQEFFPLFGASLLGHFPFSWQDGAQKNMIFRGIKFFK